MKILQVAPGYYPRIGGLEYVVKSVSERLVKIGHEVAVLAGEPDVDQPREEEVNGVRVIRWPTWSPSEAYHFPRKRSGLEELLKGLARQVDVVHAHSVHSVFVVLSSLMIASDAGSIKVVATPHYHGTGHSFIRRVLWIPWRRRVAKLLKRASAIHAVSRREASILASHYPEARDKIVIIPNGISHRL
jgi:glycosyltransferase involved in cell wall biosynthesis